MSTAITNLDQLVEQLVPLVLSAIRSKSQKIETLTIQQDMTGITSLPGYDTTGGQYKAVLVPIEALKEPARTAGAAAEDAATKANAAAKAATEVLEGIEATVTAAYEATAAANTAADTANAAAENVAEQAEYATSAGKFAISSGETAIASSETAKSSAALADTAAENANTAADNANDAADNANQAYNMAVNAQETASDALTQAQAAVDAIATLKGLENSDEAMALIAEQIARIAVNTNEISALKAMHVFLTESEYQTLVDTGTIEQKLYLIYEE